MSNMRSSEILQSNKPSVIDSIIEEDPSIFENLPVPFPTRPESNTICAKKNRSEIEDINQSNSEVSRNTQLDVLKDENQVKPIHDQTEGITHELLEKLTVKDIEPQKLGPQELEQ